MHKTNMYRVLRVMLVFLNAPTRICNILNEAGRYIGCMVGHSRVELPKAAVSVSWVCGWTNFANLSCSVQIFSSTSVGCVVGFVSKK